MPQLHHPAAWHSLSTCVNSPPSAVRGRFRKSLIVRKSGVCRAVTAMTSTRFLTRLR